LKKFIILTLLICSPTCFSDTAYINEIPDFTQTNIKGKNSGNGQQYCAPTAVSNSIIWLSHNENKQLNLIRKLASKSYMNTNLKNGTGTTGLLRGVEKIAQELFGSYQLLEYKGWRKHPKSYSKGVKIPNIKRI